MSSIKGKKSEQSGESIVSLTSTNKSVNSSVVGDQSSDLQQFRGSKLVFGLSSRTNRLKHAEYAERRSGQSLEPTYPYPSNNNSNTNSSNNNSSNNMKVIDRSAANASKSNESLINGNSVSSSDKEGISAGRNTSSGSKNKIRASKYGNFYKPQELIDSANKMRNEIKVSSDDSGKQEVSSTMQKRKTTNNKIVSKHDETKRVSSLEENGESVKSSDSVKRVSKEESASKISRNSIDKDKVNVVGRKKDESQYRKQFNIPPPPQVRSKSPSLANSSVVSYAKSRIYDKPSATSLLLDSGKIPESILSGFKPPKQVSVSKAREKWEGGELFAKTKSNRRLAAQAAGKKLLHGTWSMTSVVATQQMQFQQALANSSSPVRSNLERTDPTVKILTRGSVLERVQQFEKVPASSASDTSSTSSSSSDNYDEDDSSSLTSESEASIELDTGKQQQQQQTVQPVRSPPGKQAQYKQLVSTIQTAISTVSSGNNLPLVATPKVLHSPRSQNPTSQSVRRSSLRRRSSCSSNSSAATIPRFYHPNGKPNTYEMEIQKKNIVACFDKLPDRKASLDGPASKRHFHSISLACGLSEYYKIPLNLYVKHHLTNSNLLHGSFTARKTSVTAQNGSSPLSIQQPRQLIKLTRAASVDNSTVEKLQNQAYITCDQFLTCWLNMLSTCFDNESKFIHLLTSGQRNYLLPQDFVPLLQSVIDDHPGLKFLRSAPDFHMRYIQTVIARIYFCINKSWTGKININELRRSNLLAVLKVLSQEEDINQITDYFSYEHFYVIYCKFWNLDQDHDLLISKEDLARHNDAAISSRIIDRIFMGIVSKEIQETGKMSYSDFVWFLLAEEDKKHPRSIEYWFRLMDIDGDGYISMYELEYFYYEQTKRLELMNIEALPFLDTACQILDLINPREKNKISLSDLKKTKLATIFFDTFINLEKYLEHESREFVSSRDVVQDGVIISDWDRYASEEYENLVTEETSI